jgi:hypothetical protein
VVRMPDGGVWPGGRGFVPIRPPLPVPPLPFWPMQVSERVGLNAPYAGVQKIRTRLGGSMFVVDPFPEKPKRMRWATYWRLIEQANEAELERLKALGYTTESKSPGQGSAPK